MYKHVVVCIVRHDLSTQSILDSQNMASLIQNMYCCPLSTVQYYTVYPAIWIIDPSMKIELESKLMWDNVSGLTMPSQWVGSAKID